MSPRVSILTRTQDRSVLLERAIQSVLGQNFTQWEHILVNDGGNPDELELVLHPYRRAYGDRLIVLHNHEPRGMQEALNRGVVNARGEFLCIHDDDDSWGADFLRATTAFLDREGADSRVQGVATQVVRIDEFLREDGFVAEMRREPYQPFEAVDLQRAAGENPFPPIALCYRRSVHETIGHFRQRFGVLGDWDFNLRFLAAFDIGVLDRPLAHYHWRAEGPVHGTLGNSVSAGLDEHERRLVDLRNHHLREDLYGRGTGLGRLLARARTEREEREERETQGKRLRDIDHNLFVLRRGSTANRSTESALPPPPPSPAPPADKAPRRAKDVVADLLQATRGKRAVLLDVFDTCLLRSLERPTDLFDYLSDRLREETGPAFSRFPFARARVLGEQQARGFKLDSGTPEGEVTLEEIYLQVCSLCRIGPEWGERGILHERSLEGIHLYANPVLRDFVEALREQGKPVLFLSDMYWSSSQIATWLREHGFGEEPEVMVSCEEGVSKHSGALYARALERLGLPPGDLLCIGDNAHSDVARARDNSIEACLWKSADLGRPYRDQSGFDPGYTDRRRLSSLCTGLARRDRLLHRQRPLWERLGYEVAGPLYFSFLNRIVRRSRELGLEKIYFLARDGHYLHRAYEKVREAWSLPQPGTYLYASRRLYNFACIERLDDEAIEFLATPNPRLRVRDFFERIGLRAEDYAAAIAARGLPGLDEVITTARGAFREPRYYWDLHALFWEASVQIVEKARAERTELLAYLGEAGLKEGRAAIVDIGWQASSLRSLVHLLGGGQAAERLYGFYLATWKYAARAANDGCRFESLLVHRHRPQHRADLLEESVALLEVLFTAPLPSIVGLHRTSEGWEPVGGPPDLLEEQYSCLESLWTGTSAFLDDALRRLPGPAEDDALPYLDRTLDRVLRHPLAEEARIWGALRHREGFGANRAFPIVPAAPSTWERLLGTRNLREEYDHCAWKRGLLSTLPPAERARLLQPTA